MQQFTKILMALIVFISFSVHTVQSAATVKASKPAYAKAKKKIVFIAGKDSHGRGDHEFRAGCHLLARLLNETRTDINALVTEDGWPKDISILDDADVIVMYSDGADGHMVMPHLEEVDKLIKKGVGMVAMHYAIEVPKGKAGDYFYSWIGGYFETFYSVNPFFIPVFEPLPKHDVTRGVKPFQVRDEWYYHLRFIPETKKLKPILYAHPPMTTLTSNQNSQRGNNEFVRKDLQDNKLQTMAWTYERPDGGRSFGFSGGHAHNNWANDEFRKLVLNAIVWTAKLKVPKEGVVTPTPNAKELEYLLKAPRQPRAGGPPQGMPPQGTPPQGAPQQSAPPKPD